MNTKHISMSMTLATLLLLAPGLYAQESGVPTQAAQPAASVDEATVNRFADALSSVQAIQQDFSGKLQKVDGQEQARELQMKAQEKMVTAVKESGLKVGEYNSLAAMMEQDAQLRQRVMSKMDQ
jgi:hypothetical protein